MIEIREAKSPAEMRQFVRFPFRLYRETPQWVPPLISEELNSLHPSKNPVFKHAQAWFYLAFQGPEVVGRIAVIANWAEIRDQNIRKIRFGWFDFTDDKEVSSRLLEKALEKGRELELDYAEGPMGFSNLDKVGMMTEGFDTRGNMITWYNHAYYVTHMKDLGYVPEKEYLEWSFPRVNADPALFMKASQLIKKRYQLRPLSFRRNEDIMPYADKMFDLFNVTYSRLSSFVAISDEQKAYMKKKYLSFINPEFIKFVVDKDDELIAFAIVMPNFADALKKANGRLFPLGWYHLLQAKKHVKEVTFYLIGIREDYQNKGVTAVIFEEYHKTFTEKGVEMCHRTPELADNKAIQAMWKNFDPKVVKKRCTFRKNL